MSRLPRLPITMTAAPGIPWQCLIGMPDLPAWVRRQPRDAPSPLDRPRRLRLVLVDNPCQTTKRGDAP